MNLFQKCLYVFKCSLCFTVSALLAFPIIAYDTPSKHLISSSMGSSGKSKGRSSSKKGTSIKRSSPSRSSSTKVRSIPKTRTYSSPNITRSYPGGPKVTGQGYAPVIPEIIRHGQPFFDEPVIHHEQPYFSTTDEPGQVYFENMEPTPPPEPPPANVDEPPPIIIVKKPSDEEPETPAVKVKKVKKPKSDPWGIRSVGKAFKDQCERFKSELEKHYATLHYSERLLNEKIAKRAGLESELAAELYARPIGRDYPSPNEARLSEALTLINAEIREENSIITSINSKIAELDALLANCK